MKAEASIQKQFEYQKKTHDIIVSMLKAGEENKVIAEAVGVYVTEVKEIQKQVKRDEVKAKKGYSSGHSFFRGKSIFDNM